MMKVTLRVERKRLVIEVEGKIAGPWTDELRKSWEEASAQTGERALEVKLSGVTFIDEPGKALLAAMRRSGTRIHAEECLNRAILEEIESLHASRGRSSARLSKNSSKGALLLLLPTLFLLPGHIKAQERPPLRLTLRDAVVLALKENPQVQIAALDLARSKQDRSIARAQLLPKTNLGVFDRVQRLNLQANIGLHFPGIPQHAGPFQTFQAGTQLSMPVLDLTLWRRWQAAGRAVTSTEDQRRTTREQIALLVVSQYLGCLRAGAEVKAARARVDLAQALYDQAQDLQQHGVATGVDTLRANVELQNEKQRLIAAETSHQTALFGLARLLSIDPQQPIELVDEMSFYSTPEFRLEETLTRAYAARPELLALEASRQALAYQKRAASESRFPSLRFDGAYAQQGLSASTVIPTYAYQASVVLPIFTGGQIRAEIARADLDLEKIAQRVRDEKNQIALEVQTSAAQLAAARHEVEVANLGVRLAEEEVREARDRFQAGVVNNIEVISAQDALARANDNQIAALYRFNQARADLARATGQMGILYSH